MPKRPYLCQCEDATFSPSTTQKRTVISGRAIEKVSVLSTALVLLVALAATTSEDVLPSPQPSVAGAGSDGASSPISCASSVAVSWRLCTSGDGHERSAFESHASEQRSRIHDLHYTLIPLNANQYLK